MTGGSGTSSPNTKHPAVEQFNEFERLIDEERDRVKKIVSQGKAVKSALKEVDEIRESREQIGEEIVEQIRARAEALLGTISGKGASRIKSVLTSVRDRTNNILAKFDTTPQGPEPPPDDPTDASRRKTVEMQRPDLVGSTAKPEDRATAKHVAVQPDGKTPDTFKPSQAVKTSIEKNAPNNYPKWCKIFRIIHEGRDNESVRLALGATSSVIFDTLVQQIVGKNPSAKALVESEEPAEALLKALSEGGAKPKLKSGLDDEVGELVRQIKLAIASAQSDLGISRPKPVEEKGASAKAPAKKATSKKTPAKKPATKATPKKGPAKKTAADVQREMLDKMPNNFQAWSDLFYDIHGKPDDDDRIRFIRSRKNLGIISADHLQAVRDKITDADTIAFMEAKTPTGAVIAAVLQGKKTISDYAVLDGRIGTKLKQIKVVIENAKKQVENEEVITDVDIINDDILGEIYGLGTDEQSRIKDLDSKGLQVESDAQLTKIIQKAIKEICSEDIDEADVFDHAKIMALLKTKGQLKRFKSVLKVKIKAQSTAREAKKNSIAMSDIIGSNILGEIYGNTNEQDRIDDLRDIGYEINSDAELVSFIQKAIQHVLSVDIDATDALDSKKIQELLKTKKNLDKFYDFLKDNLPEEPRTVEELEAECEANMRATYSNWCKLFYALRLKGKDGESDDDIAQRRKYVLGMEPSDDFNALMTMVKASPGVGSFVEKMVEVGKPAEAIQNLFGEDVQIGRPFKTVLVDKIKEIKEAFTEAKKTREQEIHDIYLSTVANFPAWTQLFYTFNPPNGEDPQKTEDRRAAILDATSEDDYKKLKAKLKTTELAEFIDASSPIDAIMKFAPAGDRSTPEARNANLGEGIRNIHALIKAARDEVTPRHDKLEEMLDKVDPKVRPFLNAAVEYVRNRPENQKLLLNVLQFFESDYTDSPQFERFDILHDSIIRLINDYATNVRGKTPFEVKAEVGKFFDEGLRPLEKELSETLTIIRRNTAIDAYARFYNGELADEFNRLKFILQIDPSVIDDPDIRKSFIENTHQESNDLWSGIKKDHQFSKIRKLSAPKKKEIAGEGEKDNSGNITTPGLKTRFDDHKATFEFFKNNILEHLPKEVGDIYRRMIGMPVENDNGSDTGADTNDYDKIDEYALMGNGVLADEFNRLKFILQLDPEGITDDAEKRMFERNTMPKCKKLWAEVQANHKLDEIENMEPAEEEKEIAKIRVMFTKYEATFTTFEERFISLFPKDVRKQYEELTTGEENEFDDLGGAEANANTANTPISREISPTVRALLANFLDSKLIRDDDPVCLAINAQLTGRDDLDEIVSFLSNPDNSILPKDREAVEDDRSVGESNTDMKERVEGEIEQLKESEEQLDSELEELAGKIADINAEARKGLTDDQKTKREGFRNKETEKKKKKREKIKERQAKEKLIKTLDILIKDETKRTPLESPRQILGLIMYHIHKDDKSMTPKVFAKSIEDAIDVQREGLYSGTRAWLNRLWPARIFRPTLKSTLIAISEDKKLKDEIGDDIAAKLHELSGKNNYQKVSDWVDSLATSTDKKERKAEIADNRRTTVPRLIAYLQVAIREGKISSMLKTGPARKLVENLERIHKEQIKADVMEDMESRRKDEPDLFDGTTKKLSPKGIQEAMLLTLRKMEDAREYTDDISRRIIKSNLRQSMLLRLIGGTATTTGITSGAAASTAAFLGVSSIAFPPIALAAAAGLSIATLGGVGIASSYKSSIVKPEDRKQLRRTGTRALVTSALALGGGALLGPLGIPIGVAGLFTPNLMDKIVKEYKENPAKTWFYGLSAPVSLPILGAYRLIRRFTGKKSTEKPETKKKEEKKEEKKK